MAIHVFFSSSRDDDSLIDDGTQPQDPPMFHVALDNQRENQPSTSRNVAPVIIVPYFPLGLAVSPEERMQFNFNLFLYDSLRLPNGLFPDDGAGEVVFEDLQTCREYCSRYVQKREEWCGREQVESDHSQVRVRVRVRVSPLYKKTEYIHSVFDPQF